MTSILIIIIMIETRGKVQSIFSFFYRYRLIILKTSLTGKIWSEIVPSGVRYDCQCFVTTVSKGDPWHSYVGSTYLPAGRKKVSRNRAYNVWFPSPRIVGYNTLACIAILS